MSEVHQWIHKYRAPLAAGQVISTAKPGDQIAKAITEIQNEITNMQGGDEDSEPSGIEENVANMAAILATLLENQSDGTSGMPSAEGVEDGKVLQARDGAAVWDLVRATA